MKSHKVEMNSFSVLMKLILLRGKVGLIIGVMSLSLLAVSAEAAFDPGQAFEKKCSSCHSIGDGVLKGPDLKGIGDRYKQDWLIKFIQSSDAMIQAGDPAAVKIYNKFGQKDMPDQKLSDQEVVEMLAFIKGGGQVKVDLKVKSATLSTAKDVDAGRELYLGSKSFSKGGPACISCHSVGAHGILGGGTLAKDLTHIYSDYKDKGLSIALSKLGFPVMEEVYAGKGLSESELFQVKSFLYDADKHGIEPHGFQKKFVFLGLGGLVLAMGLIDFIWRKRRIQSVRKSKGGIR